MIRYRNGLWQSALSSKVIKNHLTTCINTKSICKPITALRAYTKAYTRPERYLRLYSYRPAPNEPTRHRLHCAHTILFRMERSDLDNANPTILNVSQLPSRRQKQSAARKGPENRYDDVLFSKKQSGAYGFGNRVSSWPSSDEEDDADLPEEPIDELEIYDLISSISDPEHPHTLGQLSVVNLSDIHITPSPSENADPEALRTVTVDITPTITHCSLATVIGLAVRVRLEQALPPNYRLDIRMKKDSHAQDDQVNKQLKDKERVAAALENDTLRGVLDKMLLTCV